jgi:hypothetical protein
MLNCCHVFMQRGELETTVLAVNTEAVQLREGGARDIPGAGTDDISPCLDFIVRFRPSSLTPGPQEL